MLRIDVKHFILDGYWWKLSQFIILFFLEIYQFFFLFLKLWSDGKILAWNLLNLRFVISVIRTGLLRLKSVLSLSLLVF